MLVNLKRVSSLAMTFYINKDKRLIKMLKTDKTRTRGTISIKKDGKFFLFKQTFKAFVFVAF